MVGFCSVEDWDGAGLSFDRLGIVGITSEVADEQKVTRVRISFLDRDEVDCLLPDLEPKGCIILCAYSNYTVLLPRPRASFLRFLPH
jgi:hypothetical protein